jgi:hypothetical protein
MAVKIFICFLIGLSIVNGEALTGYLMDRRCWSMALQGFSIGDGTDPLTAAHSHTVLCMSMLQCVASGFHIVVNSERKQADDGKMYLYSVSADISQSNTSAIYAFLKTVSRGAQIYVTATGSRDLSGEFVLAKLIDAYDSRSVPSGAYRVLPNLTLFVLLVVIAVLSPMITTEQPNISVCAMFHLKAGDMSSSSSGIRTERIRSDAAPFRESVSAY